MGPKILPQKSGEILLEIIMCPYENRSTMMTSNRPIEEWGKLLSDARPPAHSTRTPVGQVGHFNGLTCAADVFEAQLDLSA